ncbi:MULTISPECIES: hypothetical protein [unclassified Streptomyces]|uniref:hypothetical protein n=1 Tax=unclassified Streptomyces TaxID=2593676 RepID=UPI002E2D442B|nr:hypothetical protein [Streptomyces sp. NBC_00223]
MSANVPPPQQPPGGQNPFAQPAPGEQNPYAQPTPGEQNPYAQQPPAPGQNPYAQPVQPGQQGQPFAPGQPGQPGQPPYGAPPAFGQPQGAPGFNGLAYPPPAPVAPARENVALALLVGVVTTLVVAAIYGGILRAMSKNDGTFYEFRLLAIAVGALVGLVVGKIGGRNPVVPVASLVFALAAVVLGELFGGALIISHYLSTHGADMSVSTIIFQHFGDLWSAWKSDFGVSRVFFLVFAAGAGFALAKRFGEN